MNELLKDSELIFPHYMVLKASAGAGKTRALTSRYVQFLLSENIPFNDLQNIIAITFSNNATKEMKERILLWLKELYLQKERAISEFSGLIKFEDGKDFRKALSEKAGQIIERILNNYSDFQVRTIDSFMTSIFKSSAIESGYNPDFEILMDNRELLSYAFELFLKDIKEGTEKADIFKRIIDLILELKGSDSGYLWDPAVEIFKKWKDLYSIITADDRELIIEECLLEDKKNAEKKLAMIMNKIMDLLKGVDENFLNKNSGYSNFPEILNTGQFFLLKTANLPLKKRAPLYDEVKPLWTELQTLYKEYLWYYSLSYYIPYLKTFRDFLKELEKIKLKEEKLFIEDINKTLSEYLNSSIVPDIYFRLGERIYHFLIDEFQDTSPLQWKNLMPLIENALSVNGSLFIVGDTKQAIYEFRNADYRIMKRLEDDKEKVFPSATLIKAELKLNYRSGGEIVRFNEKLFKKTIVSLDGYRESAFLSGLTDYVQQPLPEREDKGYVEIKVIKKEEVNDHIISIIEELHIRGYSYSEIAILAPQNREVIAISEGLNKRGIPFISYSSLDVRQRKVTGEILALLGFLDSPIDDFSFSIFLQSDIYKRYLASKEGRDNIDFINSFLLRHSQDTHLYKLFEKEFPGLWEDHFKHLFRLAGYLPLYDLLSMALGIFRVFEIMPEEEATFLKLLELANLFEAKGFGNIKDFIEFMESTGSDERIWDLSLPEDKEAVTVMTIHKSKGLEFPATIVYITEPKRPNSSMIPIKFDNGISIVKLTDPLTANERLRDTREEFLRDKITSQLNLLYVAFTRAKDELYILVEEERKKEEKDKRAEKFNISTILSKETDNPRGTKLTKKEIEDRRQKERKEILLTLNLSHYPFSKEFPVEEREIHLYEKERGEFIHHILAFIDYYEEGLDEKISQIIEKLNRDAAIRFPKEEIKGAVIKTLQSLKEYFKKIPGRIIRNEKEFSDLRGFLFRMDRVVIDPQVVTVIDYKTGTQKPEDRQEDLEQVRHYKKILKEIYKDKEIKGLLYYIDKEEVIEV
ncbi:MAG: UvrD-helicase domain-containing protein [Thermodesulfovibrionales bacterium]